MRHVVLFFFAATTALSAGCLSDSGFETSRSALFPCVRDGQNYCAICAPVATDTAAELSTGCADALRRPGQQAEVNERMGNLRITLSGEAHVPIFGDQDVAEMTVEYRGRFFRDGARLGVELTAEVNGGQEYTIPAGERPSFGPVAANGNGDYVGDMVVPIDFGRLGNADLAANDNERDADVHISFRLQGGNDLASATAGTGQVESLHVEDVRLAQGGGRIGIVIDLDGPVAVTFDALAEPEVVDPVGTPEWRACMQQIITRDCCVGPAVFADAVRIAQLPAGLTPPADCSADEPEEEEDEPIVEEEEDEDEPLVGGAGHEAGQPIALGAPPVVREGAIAAGVQDWYSIEVPAAGRYSFETTTGNRNDNSATDTKLEVFAAGNAGAGASFGSNDDGSDDGAGSKLEVALPAGRVLIEVWGYGPATVGPYTLAIGAVGAVVEEEPAEEEPAAEEPAAEEDPQDEPFMEPPDERVQPATGYDVTGRRLHCEGNDGADAACWNNVNRQIIGGGGLRGRTLTAITWEMDASARLSDTLEIEMYLIHGVGPGYGQVVETTRKRVDVMTALERGTCVERGEVITCTARYDGHPRLPQAGQAGDDWFILEFVGRDAGDVAPDGTLACGRYPHRVAENAYTDPTVNLGGYVQLHDWAGPSCEFEYTTVARRADLDLAARISVE